MLQHPWIIIFDLKKSTIKLSDRDAVIMHFCTSQIIGSFSSYCRHLKARASPPIPANPPFPLSLVSPRTHARTPAGAKNRTQLALQGLHISHSSQHAPEHFCPSCPIFSSGTRGGSLFFPNPPFAHPVFELFFTSLAGLRQACSSDKIHDYTLENLQQNRHARKTKKKWEDPDLPVSSERSTRAAVTHLHPHFASISVLLTCLCSHRWATVRMCPIAMTRNSHSSDMGGLVGAASHRLKVKPALAVWTASERSQKHRLSVGGGLFSENWPDGDAPWGMQQKTEMLPWKRAMMFSLMQLLFQCHS